MDAITFTRASNGTYVGEDGLLKSYSNQGALGKNLLTFPQDFDNAAWIKQAGHIVTADQALAPDGTLTADLIVGNNSTNGVYQAVSGSTNAQNTKSIYLRAVSGTVTVNIKDPSLTIGNTTCNLTTEWQRFTLTEAGNVFGGFQGGIWIYNIPPSGIYAWGAQFEFGSSATEYFPTNIGVPRFDWGSTTQLPRKNLLQNTEAFDATSWTKSSLTVSANVAVAPDESTTADKLIENSGAPSDTLRGRRTLASGLPSQIEYGVASIYVEAAGRTQISIGCELSTICNMIGVDLNTNQSLGTVVNAGPGNMTTTFISCTTVTGNIKRVVVLLQNITRLGLINFTVGLMNNETVNYSGDGVSGVNVWGAQLEIGTELSDYQAVSYVTTNTPLAANPTPNGILIEEARTNRVLWNRDATQTVPYTTPDNFFAQSETFTDASWNFDGNQAQLVRTENQSDPFDGTSATKIVPNAGRTAANAYIGQRSGASYPSTHSIYAKAAEYEYLVLSLFTYGAGNFAVFNLSDGTITTLPTVAGLTAAIESVGDGWYRCSLTTSNETLNRGFLVSVSPNGTTTATAAGGSGIFIYGAHSNNGNTPTTYVQTTVLDSPLWVLSDITAAKDQTGIDGVANAVSSLTATANNGTCFQYVTLLSGVRSCSAYLKRITGTGVVQVSLDGVTFSTVDLSDTEWRRVVLSGTVTNPVLGIKLTTSGDSVAMDFAQVEDLQGASSPIFTTTASVTRVADVTGILLRNLNSSVIDANKFSAYAEFDFIFRNSSASGGDILALGTFNNNLVRTIIGIDGRNNVGFLVPRANSLLPIIGDIYKVFVSYKGGTDGSIAPRTNTTSIDGVSYPISANYFLLLSTPIDRIGIGCTYRNPTITNVHSGRIRRIILWPNDFSESVVTEYTK
jgi:hypothetical protein